MRSDTQKNAAEDHAHSATAGTEAEGDIPEAGVKLAQLESESLLAVSTNFAGNEDTWGALALHVGSSLTAGFSS
jgi:hypothetical protein